MTMTIAEIIGDEVNTEIVEGRNEDEWKKLDTRYDLE
jgi:hypothetical protein